MGGPAQRDALAQTGCPAQTGGPSSNRRPPSGREAAAKTGGTSPDGRLPGQMGGPSPDRWPSVQKADQIHSSPLHMKEDHLVMYMYWVSQN